MIVSHRHRFIFLKTRKTAGTSVEIALSKVCGDDDIITPLSGPDALARREYSGRDAQNVTVAGRRYLAAIVQARRIPRSRPQFYNHMDARSIRAFLGSKIWDNYYKFTIERNPFDRLISQYYFQNRNEASLPGFSEWLQSARNTLNWPLYSIENNIAVDQVIQYDELVSGLATVGERIGVEIALAGYRAKSNTRLDRRPPSQFLTSADIELIGRICRPEIEHFGYRPD